MKNKLSINQQVWKALNADLAINKDLHRDLINTRALARYLLKKFHLSASLDSIISSIRRFQSEEDFGEAEEKIISVFKNSIISTKNNIVCITLNLLPHEFFQKVCALPIKNNQNWRIITGRKDIKIFIEHTQLVAVKNMFSKETITKIEDDLSEISVVVSEEAVQTKGVLAKMAGEIALANINISEIVICTPEFFIYVKQKDILKAHESILKLGRE